jgi:uncharacterized membrane protein YhaH (DUF805 family)
VKKIRINNKQHSAAVRPNITLRFFSLFAEPLVSSGRANRKQFWGLTLLTLAPLFATAFFPKNFNDLLDGWVGNLYALFIFIYLFIGSVCLGIRRLHDLGHSGLWMLLMLSPGLPHIILGFWPGQPRENKYGPIP